MRRLSIATLAVLGFTIGMILFCAGEALAQEARSVRYGLSMGLNMSKIVWTDSWMADFGKDNRLSQPSMRYDGVVEIAISPSISVLSGAGYRMTGEKYSGANADGSTFWMKRMGGYLTTPVLLKYTAGTILGLRPFLQLGPQVGFLLSFYGMGDATGMRVEMMQNVKRATLELRGGTGFEFPMGRMHTGVVEVGYEYGLTSFVKSEVQMPAKARNIHFTMGLMF
jgi:hypothetical protein